MLTITLPDNSVRTFDAASVTPYEVAVSIGSRLAKEALAAKVDGRMSDLHTPITQNASVAIITPASDEGREILRHSTSHVMAQAVKDLFGGEQVKVAIGPAINEGFYYDFDMEYRLAPEDLERIEKRMREIIASDGGFSRQEVTHQEAVDIFTQQHEVYKVELLEGIDAPTVSLYRCGSFTDLCRGPHVPSYRHLGAFKLLSIAGAYWRGDEKRPMLQRIYGTAFATEKELKEYLHQLEEAKKRDHRKLGKDLGLFHFDPEVASASPFFHPRGATIYNELIGFLRTMYRHEGYQEVITPQVLDVDLWHRSGHYDNYQENMFFTSLDDKMNALKPMNCPTHVLIYGAQNRSYRELPLRYTDFGRLHRYERSGVVQGLTRVRTFSQDDGHIFCRPDQIEAEIKNLIDLIVKIYKVFGFETVKIGLSTRPEKSIGSDEIWEKAQSALRWALESSGTRFHVNEGDGAFYGPKIDFQVSDAIRRDWQLATIQLDFSMPSRFDVSYVGEDGTRQTPVLIHRAIFGSLERFMGLYLEHTAGAVPFWLAPIQVTLIPVSDSHVEFCRNLAQTLIGIGLRVEVDLASESMGKKIRNSQILKTPFTLVVGDREMNDHVFGVRRYGEKEPFGATWPELLAMLHEKRYEAHKAMGYLVPPVHQVPIER